MFERLGAFISCHWGPIVVAWVLLACLLHAVAPRWDQVTHDGDLAYLPDNLPSTEGERLMARAFPEQRAKSQVAIVVERPGAALATPDWLWSDSLADRFRERQGDLPIVDVWNRNSEVVGERLTSRVSTDGQATVTLLHVKNEFMATGNMGLVAEVQHMLDEARSTAPAGLTVGITGSAAVGGDMLRSAAESIKNTELTTVALVVVILLLVYRAPLLVSIPLVTIGVALFVATDILALLTQLSRVPGFSWWNFKIFTTTKIFIVVILFGAGTDFCLFLISRYKEELERGLARGAAVIEAVARVGEALVGSAMTTICGLGMMFFADFGKFRNSGPAIALCLAVTLVACLSLAPALLAASGRAVFWPFGIRVRAAGTVHHELDDSSRSNRFWQWTGSAIVRRPGLILVASVALLTPLAYAGLSVRLTYDFLNELENSCASVQGTALAKLHFPAGEMAPVTILALQDGGHFDTPEGEVEIARLTKILYDIPGVESVRSIAEPLGNRPGYFQPFRARGLNKLAARKHKQTKATYLTQVPDLLGDVARFDVVLHDEPFSLEAIALLNRVDARLAKLRGDRQSHWHNAKFAFIGTTVGIRDLASVTGSDQRLIQQLVVLGVLAVLITLLRRPVVCVYLIVSVLFSYFVTIGATELFFSWLYGSTFHGLDWKVPIFLFVILIAVGEDYNIYLVTRVLEEQRRHGPIAGLRSAVAKTGGIITSCGLIMAGTFISMASGKLRGMSELGFALSLGVMLDTCVVRPVLVPAFLALLERGRTDPPPAAAADAPPLQSKLPAGTAARG
jgi:putative drug exporter of the RND superfamily